MRVTYDSISLASGDLALGRVGPSGLSVNGVQAVDEVEYYRALTKAYHGLGLRGVEFTFAVTRLFATEAQAELFALTHHDDLPDEGDLVVVCGEDAVDEASAGITGAVLASVDIQSVRGLAVTVRYRFQGGRFAAWPSES